MCGFREEKENGEDGGLSCVIFLPVKEEDGASRVFFACQKINYIVTLYTLVTYAAILTLSLII